MNISELYKRNIFLMDELVASYLKNQVMDRRNKDFGGYWNSNILRMDPGFTCGLIYSLLASYYFKDSRFYKSKKILKRAEAASYYILKVQRKDGTIDLPFSNVHSVPDLAFAIRPICEAYKLLQVYRSKETKLIRQNLAKFIKKGTNGLKIGEVHTPNHRWVVVAALGAVNSIFPNKELRLIVEDFLSDGIDVNDEGMYYYEKSGIYSAISNDALIDASNFWKKPYLLDFVRKNLNFMIYNIHPNGYIVTDFSRRQDRASDTLLSSLWYKVYKKMAFLDKNKLYASMARWIIALNLRRNIPIGYEHKRELEELFSLGFCRLPESYFIFFPVSKLIRIRNKNLSITVMADNFDNFFSFRVGDIGVISTKIMYNLWGWRYFNPPRITKLNSKTFVLKDIYFGKVVQAGNREYHLRTNFSVIVKLMYFSSGIIMDISTTGEDNIVLRIDIKIRNEGYLVFGQEKINLKKAKENEIPFIRKYVTVKSKNGSQKLIVSGGHSLEHKVKEWWRGCNPWDRLDKKGFKLYLNLVTPIEHRIVFKAC
ncbi:MAG: hypothetical protein ACP5IT_07175 [Thermoproteota archaeon]